MKRIVVLVSGSGSNLQSIIDRCEANDIHGNIVAVISNRPGVMGLERAIKHGIDALTLNHQHFDNRESFDEALRQRIDSYQPDLVVLAGFMRILTDGFVNHYLGRMLNIHPSLLPKYAGLNTHRRALEAGDTHAGATVHFVTPELDGGPLIIQASVPVDDHDDEQSLAQKVLTVEHQLYPTAIQWFCSGTLTLAEGRAHLNGEVLHLPVQMNNTHQ